MNNILVDHIYNLTEEDKYYKASLKIQEINRIIDGYLFARKVQDYETKFSSLPESKDVDEEEIQMDLAEKKFLILSMAQRKQKTSKMNL